MRYAGIICARLLNTAHITAHVVKGIDLGLLNQLLNLLREPFNLLLGLGVCLAFRVRHAAANAEGTFVGGFHADGILFISLRCIFWYP